MISQVLLEKRPATGIWGGLWSLPEISGAASLDEIRLACLQRFNFKIKQIEFGESFRHTFSHFHLEQYRFLFLSRNAGKIMEAGQQIWYNLQQPEAVGLPRR